MNLPRASRLPARSLHQPLARRGWLGLLAGVLALGLAAPVAAQVESMVPERPSTTIAVVDFAVTGIEPRYWLGSVYAETLARRLRLSHDAVIVPPMETRALAPPVAPQDMDMVAAEALRVARLVGADYGLSGLIDDRGETLVVTPVVIYVERETRITESAETTFDKLFEPQVQLVVNRFVSRMSLRPTRVERDLMTAYDPQAPTLALELVGRGWRAYAPDDPFEAWRLWGQARELAPASPLVIDALTQTRLAYRQRLLDQTYLDARALWLAQPSNAEANYLMAESLMALGRWADAEAHYLAAVEGEPSRVDAWVGLAGARARQNLYTPALIALDQALARQPEHLKALHNKAWLLYSRGEVNAARVMWEYIRDTHPEDRLAQQRLEQYAAPPSPVDPLNVDAGNRGNLPGDAGGAGEGGR